MMKIRSIVFIRGYSRIMIWLGIDLEDLAKAMQDTLLNNFMIGDILPYPIKRMIYYILRNGG